MAALAEDPRARARILAASRRMLAPVAARPAVRSAVRMQIARKPGEGDPFSAEVNLLPCSAPFPFDCTHNCPNPSSFLAS